MLNCFVCNGEPGIIDNVDETGDMVRVYTFQVMCFDCGTRGPQMSSEYDGSDAESNAIYFWDMLNDKG